jgi:alpha-1,3-fucosyltransferase
MILSKSNSIQILVKHNMKNYFIYTTVAIALSCLYYFSSLKRQSLIYENELHSNIQVQEYVQPNKCNPIIEDAIQDTFLIDDVQYPRNVPLFLNKSINFTCLNQSKKPKYILYWNRKWYNDEITLKFKNKTFHELFLEQMNCPVTNCRVSDDREDLNKSNLVVFSIDTGSKRIDKHSFDGQRWIFDFYESPHSLDNGVGYSILKQFGYWNQFPTNMFNLSATYRSDSDFSQFYYRFFNLKWEKNEEFDVNRNFIQNKTKMAFQVVSHCKTLGKRDIYIRELQKHIDIDVFGKCGKPCPLEDDFRMNMDCKTRLITEYKFYLAFENTICKDYITEKFFSLVHYDIIPVVYGAGPYDTHVPKSAYINAFDFESPQKLAEYMLKVANDAELYNSYFKWKQYMKYIKYPDYFTTCEMCIMLNLEEYFGIKRSVIPNTQEFWNSKIDCQTIDDNNFNLIPL